MFHAKQRILTFYVSLIPWRNLSVTIAFVEFEKEDFFVRAEIAKIFNAGTYFTGLVKNI